MKRGRRPLVIRQPPNDRADLAPCLDAEASWPTSPPGCVATYLVATNPGWSLDDHLFSSLISAHGRRITPYPFYQGSLLYVLNEIPKRMGRLRSFDRLLAPFRGASGTRDPCIMRNSRRFAWTTPIAMPISNSLRESSIHRAFCGLCRRRRSR